MAIGRGMAGLAADLVGLDAEAGLGDDLTPANQAGVITRLEKERRGREPLRT